MKLWLGVWLAGVIGLMGLTGCVSTPSGDSQPAAAASGAKSKLIVTPETMLVGKVTVFNPAGRFVVLDFPVGKMPGAEQLMFVYRQGLKVGEIRVTSQVRDHNVVADLISGEATRGDEVRDR